MSLSRDERSDMFEALARRREVEAAEGAFRKNLRKADDVDHEIGRTIKSIRRKHRISKVVGK